MIGVETNGTGTSRQLVLVLDNRNMRLTDQEYQILIVESIENSDDSFTEFWYGYAETDADFKLINEVWEEHLRDYSAA